MKISSQAINSNCKALLIADASKELDGFSKEQIEYINQCLKVNEKGWSQLFSAGTQVFFAKMPAQNLEAFRKAGATLVEKLQKAKLSSCHVETSADNDFVAAFAEGAILANYQFLPYFSDADKRRTTVTEISFSNLSETSATEISAVCDAALFARTLVNRPISHLNATQLAEEAEKKGAECGFSVEILNKKKIESLKMGGLLAVNKGSIDDPTFTIMEHKPANAKNSKPIVLVGKGVVYDTGGLSLKPSASMDTMKSDMGGAAAVIGAMAAISKNQLPIHVIGLVPATDNRPGGNAYAPGDVIKMFSGQTVEVLNTDAEGRMILADALHYAKKFEPQLVIDLATLTGAAARALSRFAIAGMEKNANTELKSIIKSGYNTYERIVEFPLFDEYDEMINSDIADMKNIGGPEAGAQTAGLFLARFTDYPYIHLDIAGPAFIETNDHYLRKGGTGVGVRLLYDFIKNQA